MLWSNLSSACKGISIAGFLNEGSPCYQTLLNPFFLYISIDNNRYKIPKQKSRVTVMIQRRTSLLNIGVYVEEAAVTSASWSMWHDHNNPRWEISEIRNYVLWHSFITQCQFHGICGIWIRKPISDKTNRMSKINSVSIWQISEL